MQTQRYEEDGRRRTAEEILRDGLGYTSPHVLAVLMKDAQKIADRKGWTLERTALHIIHTQRGMTK